jgi:glycosyltransferase involved in cell wall biosynthesis
MRVLHIAEILRGGIATVFNEIVPPQIEQFGAGNVQLLVPEQQASDLSAIPRDCIRTFDRRNRRLGLRSLFRECMSVLHSFNPDIVHIHSTVAGLLVRSRLRTSSWRGRVVYCPHGWAFDVSNARSLRYGIERVEHFLSARTDRIIAISDHEYREGVRIGIDPQKLVVIENGISRSRQTVQAAEWNDHRVKVLFVGRLDRQKGVDVLMRAAATLGDRIHVRVAGGRVTGNGVRMEVPPNVALLGWLSPTEVESQMRAADLVCMPSRWEGFGLVAIEAMRAAKPVVASRVGGLAGLVEDGKSGLLVAKEDAVELASALVSRSSAEWAQMGEFAKARFLRSYTSDRVHRDIMALYESLMGIRAARAYS